MASALQPFCVQRFQTRLCRPLWAPPVKWYARPSPQTPLLVHHPLETRYASLEPLVSALDRRKGALYKVPATGITPSRAPKTVGT
jgi:hypothetical protein